MGTVEESAAERFFDAIFEFFGELARLGETWGDPWGLLLPIGVALFVALVLFRGLKSVTSSLEAPTWGWLTVVIVVGALLAIAALNADRLAGDTEGTNDGGSPETTVQGG